MFTAKTLGTAFAVGAALVANPQGLGLDGIESFCGLSHRSARYVVDALLKAGAVSVYWVSTPVRGGRRKAVYVAKYTLDPAAYEDVAPDYDGSGYASPVQVDFDLEEENEEDALDVRGSVDDSFGSAPVVVVDDRSDYLPKVGSKKANNPPEFENAPYSKNINKNTNTNRINTRARKFLPVYETTVSDAISEVDLNAAPLLELRNALESILWEPSLKVDLIDRTCAGVALGLFSSNDALKEARQAVKDALREQCPVWKKFTLKVKERFNRYLKAFWDPTGDAYVSKPKKRAPFIALELNDRNERDDEDERKDFVYTDRNGRTFVAAFA